MATVNFTSTSLSKRDLLALRATLPAQQLAGLNASLTSTLSSMERTGEERGRLRESAVFMNEHDISAAAQAFNRLQNDRKFNHASLTAKADDIRSHTKQIHAEFSNNLSDSTKSTSSAIDAFQNGPLLAAESNLAHAISDRKAAVSLDDVLKEVLRIQTAMTAASNQRESDFSEVHEKFHTKTRTLDKRLNQEGQDMRVAVRTIGKLSDDKFDEMHATIASDEAKFEAKLKEIQRAVKEELEVRELHALHTVQVTGEFLKDLEKNIKEDTKNMEKHDL
jgi:hypothetical protein